MLHLRKRGEFWHARGRIRVGTETIEIKEFSTGCNNRGDAEAVAGAEESRRRADALAGDSGRKARLTLDDCLAAYLKRPHPLKDYDKTRVGLFSDRIGTRALSRADEAWQDWLANRPGIAPATLARERAILQAAINHGCITFKCLPAPRLPGVRQAKGERMVYLSGEQRASLLAAYNPAAARVVKLLAYQGMRSREATQLRWPAVSLALKTIRVLDSESKSQRGRTIPMHPEVYVMLKDMHAEYLASRRNAPFFDHVFLSSRGRPYADTRGKGGNPLSKAHETACKIAGVSGFRLHDWRHDWAARMVMAGVDMVSLQKLGGWAAGDMRMVMRYASVSAEHLREAIGKIA